MKDPRLEQIAAAGCVGKGGAGFPTHVKLSANVDTLLINAAECEPLLRKDNVVMQHHAEEVAQGIMAAAAIVGAERVIVGIKGKNKASIAAMGKNQLRPGGKWRLFHSRAGGFLPGGRRGDSCLRADRARGASWRIATARWLGGHEQRNRVDGARRLAGAPGDHGLRHGKWQCAFAANLACAPGCELC